MDVKLNLPDPAPLAAAYRSASPFPHVVIDGLYDDVLLQEIVQSLPRRFWAWRSYGRKNKVTVRKYALGSWDKLPEAVRGALGAIAAEPCVSFLRRVTGIEDLRPDPTLRGGGIHKIKRGGRLGVHIDFNRNKDGTYRRINLITFLNRSWQPEWGGDLELWNDAGPVRTISPTWGRSIVFETSGISWHGHPHPLACPRSEVRLSLASYYYSSEPSALALPNDHPTLYHPRDPLTPGPIELLDAARGVARHPAA